MVYLVLLFSFAMLSLGGFWLVLTYRYRSRGDVWLGVAHASALIVVGLLSLGAALMKSNVLIGLAGLILFSDAAVRSVRARRRRSA
jgi:hypothetical protein